jgi:hypothetical protein
MFENSEYLTNYMNATKTKDLCPPIIVLYYICSLSDSWEVEIKSLMKW